MAKVALLSTPLFKAYPWSSEIVYTRDRHAFVDKLLQNQPILPEVGTFFQVGHYLLHCFSSEHLNRSLQIKWIQGIVLMSMIK